MDYLSSYSASPFNIKPDEIEYWYSKSISDRIDEALCDEDTFEDGEPRPCEKAAEALKKLLTEAERQDAKIPKGEVSAWYGELDLTWKIDNRLLRLLAYSDDREPLLYFQSDTGETLTRGQSISPVNAEVLKEKFEWLLAS